MTPGESRAQAGAPTRRRARRVARGGFAAAVAAASAVGLVGAAQPNRAAADDTDQVAAALVVSDRSEAVSRGSAERTAPTLDAALRTRQAALAAVDERVGEVALTASLHARTTQLSTQATKISAETERRDKLLFRPTAGEYGSKFGMRRHPILGYTRMHNGVDIGGKCGQPIWAAWEGKVSSVAENGGGGLIVRVEHGKRDGKKFTTKYMHLSKFAVKAGDVLERGERLGDVGNTGLSTACHLHFETLVDDEPVDPLQFLR